MAKKARLAYLELYKKLENNENIFKFFYFEYLKKNSLYK
jgi:hypothetical protein